MIISLYFGLLAGLLLFALASHLQIAIKSRWPRQEIAYITGITAIAVYSVATYIEYGAADTAAYFTLLRAQIAVEPVIFASIIEFAFAKAEEPRPRHIIGFYIALSALTIVRLALPFSGVYLGQVMIEPYELPWGETISLASGRGSPLVAVSLAFFLGALAIAALPLARMFRKGRRGTAVVLLAAEAVLIAGIVFDFAVALGFARWFYVAEGSFVLMAIFQSFDLTDEVVNSSEFKKSLARSLEEKNTLLAEVHHRVKNNLQVVASLLSLQAKRSGSGETRAALDESAERVISIALVHEQLYSSDSFAEVDFAGFSSSLIGGLAKSHEGAGFRLESKLSISGLRIGLSKAVPLGIILNELVMNSIKHAAKAGQELRIELSLRREGGLVVLEYADGGEGFPPGRGPGEGVGLGLTLIGTLTSQLNAEGGFLPGAPGARFRISFAQEAAP